MVEEKKEAIVTFRDANGREWHPKVTARVIRDFEKLAGIGLFEAIFETFIEEGLENVEPTDSQVFLMAKKLFGNFGALTFLLYESCRGTRGVASAIVDEFKHDVSYDDFCQAITKDEVDDAIAAAVAAIFGFFPSLGALQGEEDGDSSASPREAGPGKMSTS